LGQNLPRTARRRRVWFLYGGMREKLAAGMT